MIDPFSIATENVKDQIAAFEKAVVDCVAVLTDLADTGHVDDDYDFAIWDREIRQRFEPIVTALCDEVSGMIPFEDRKRDVAEGQQELLEALNAPINATSGSIHGQLGQLYKFMQGVGGDASDQWEEWARRLQRRIGVAVLKVATEIKAEVASPSRNPLEVECKMLRETLANIEIALTHHPAVGVSALGRPEVSMHGGPDSIANSYVEAAANLGAAIAVNGETDGGD